MPSHREGSITGYITNDPASYAHSEQTQRVLVCGEELRAAFEAQMKINPGGAHPLRLPRELYDRAKTLGFNMTGYAYKLPDDWQPVFIPQSLWDAANRDGLDLTGFAVTPRLPTSSVPYTVYHRAMRVRRELEAGEPLGRFEPSGLPRWPCRGDKKE